MLRTVPLPASGEEPSPQILTFTQATLVSGA
jgi:hypothetical protein